MKKEKWQFKINDRVVVTDSGECFTGYSQMFDELGFKKLDSNPGFEEGTSARIFGMREHPHSDCLLIALVDDEGNECLTSNLGVVMAKETATDLPSLRRISARLSKIESQLDQLATAINKPAKSQTAVEWLIEELESYDYATANSHYDICISAERFDSIKKAALEMEQKQNCK